MGAKNITKIEELADEQWVIELQIKLGLPSDFFRKLLHEDDWSFVIKLHALLEALCSDLLVHRLNEPNLNEIVTRLELSNKTFGKLAFIKELKLLSTEGRRYVSSLSEWRNKFVHNVRNCSASLSDVVSKMDGGELKKFVEDFNPQGMKSQRFEKMNIPGYNDLVTRAPKIEGFKKRAKDNPKLYIWIGAYDVLVEIIEKYSHNEHMLYGRALEITGQYEEDDLNDSQEEQNSDLEES